MPSLEEALHKQAEAEVAASERIAEGLARERLAAEHAEFARLERLMVNEDVAWLLGEMKTLVDAENITALNAKVEDATANKARQRHDIAKTMHELLKTRHAQMKNRLNPDVSA